MSHDKPTRIPIQHMPSGHFAIGDNLGGPDDNTADMEQVAPGWYRPAPPAPYAIHHRQRRDVVPPTVAPEVHAVPTVTRRQRVTPADPVLMAMVKAILDSIRISVAADGSIPSGADERAFHLGSAIEAGVRNGVMVVGEEIDRLRGMLESFVDIIDPPGAPACFELDPDIVKAAAKAMRAGMAVRK